MSFKPVLTHIAQHVKNVEACIRFYQEFCQLTLTHQRDHNGKSVAWLAEEGKESEFILVLISGGEGDEQQENDFSHLGFAVESKQAVDEIAEKAEAEGCLLWPPVQEDFPVGYYCGVLDPDGRAVEFSYGQPLGPGAEPGAENIKESMTYYP